MNRIERISLEEAEERIQKLREWDLVDDGTAMVRSVTLPDFAASLAVANAIGVLADEANHHPDLLISYGFLRITLSTHDVEGLTEKDFQLAEKIDGVLTPDY